MKPDSPSSEQLEALVRQAQAGDEQAFSRLVERCYSQIYRWALVRTNDGDDAEDVTQNVLVRLYTRLRQYDGRSRFTTWLYRVTANTAGGFFRKRAARQRAADRFSEPDAAHPGATDPLDRIHTANLTERVMAFFRELPQKQREIFDLVDLQGFAPTEIAEMLDMNPVTVRAHLCKARRTVRRRMLAEATE